MANLKYSFWLIGLILMCLTSACSKSINVQQNDTSANNNDLTPWLDQLITEIQQKAPANPPIKIYRYTYNSQVVFYLTGYCCDIPAKLYNANGQLLCEPDGGITGRGDGRCTDFFEKRQNETLIWEDKRES
jgi:hypothetical protein